MSDKPKKRRAGNDSKPKPRKNSSQASKSTKVPCKKPARKLTKGERTERKKVTIETMSADVEGYGAVHDLHDRIHDVVDAIKTDNPAAYTEAVHQVSSVLQGLVNYWIKCVPRTWHDFEVELAED